MKIDRIGIIHILTNLMKTSSSTLVPSPVKISAGIFKILHNSIALVFLFSFICNSVLVLPLSLNSNPSFNTTQFSLFLLYNFFHCSFNLFIDEVSNLLLEVINPFLLPPVKAKIFS